MFDLMFGLLAVFVLVGFMMAVVATIFGGWR